MHSLSFDGLVSATMGKGCFIGYFDLALVHFLSFNGLKSATMGEDAS